MITTAQLIAAGIGPTQAKLFADPLTAACKRFDIDSSARIAAFVGQCMVESGLFVHTEENMFYSDPARLASIFKGVFHGSAAEAVSYTKNPQKCGNHVYANRADLGNGDEASGDGWNYRGRGVIQLTGKAAYRNAAIALGHDYVVHPELLAQPEDACLSAAWFWHSKNLNSLADANAIDAITRAVNGTAMLEAPLRKQYTQQALDAILTH